MFFQLLLLYKVNVEIICMYILVEVITTAAHRFSLKIEDVSGDYYCLATAFIFMDNLLVL